MWPLRSRWNGCNLLIFNILRSRRGVPEQLRDRTGVDAVVDGFVRYAVLMPFGVDLCHDQGDLLGRPASLQQTPYDLEQHGVGVQFTRRTSLRATTLAACCAGVRLACGVATQLTADGAGRAAKHARDLTHAAVLLPEAGEGHAVFGLELVVGSGFGRHLRTLQHGRCCTSDFNPPLQLKKLRCSYLAVCFPKVGNCFVIFIPVFIISKPVE